MALFNGTTNHVAWAATCRGIRSGEKNVDIADQNEHDRCSVVAKGISFLKTRKYILVMAKKYIAEALRILSCRLQSEAGHVLCMTEILVHR